ncbi:hypothetical protein SCHPADRAFT_572229 [Schizopora paradoxa]|uniref:Uncharacterized protein n=1 Tax=Schizopora paradoxa TaxID=27342 RepID=A0A0H2RCP7_9AGAM|nr:hypothetical protein SCHPADRAFT_572229 [Schizopora paradoxa]
MSTFGTYGFEGAVRRGVFPFFFLICLCYLTSSSLCTPPSLRRLIQFIAIAFLLLFTLAPFNQLRRISPIYIPQPTPASLEPFQSFLLSNGELVSPTYFLWKSERNAKLVVICEEILLILTVLFVHFRFSFMILWIFFSFLFFELTLS